MQGGVRTVLALHEIFTKKHLSTMAPSHGADAFTHAPLAHHAPSQLGTAHQIIGGTGGDGVEHNELRRPTPHGHGQSIADLLLGGGMAIFVG